MKHVKKFGKKIRGLGRPSNSGLLLDASSAAGTSTGSAGTSARASEDLGGPTGPIKADPSASSANVSSETKNAIIGGLRSILKVAKDASAPFPPLQTAVSSVTTLIDLYDVSVDSFAVRLVS